MKMPVRVRDVEVQGVITFGNTRIGRVTLVAGTATVNNSTVTNSSMIIPVCQQSSGTPGFLRISARVVGTSFTITSSSNTDTSIVGWIMFES